MDIAIEDLKARVSERYGTIARQHLTNAPVIGGCCGGASCCGEGADLGANQALALYTAEEIKDLPSEIAGATLGCGNPTAIASLKPGETVLDLGSGAGLDCFLAARQVGPAGHVIGLDMTDSMLELARRNQARVGLENVEFRKGEMEQMPVGDGAVDIIISNCVINLSTDKTAVFREAFRVLKPGGRFVVSDVVTRGEVPVDFRRALDLWSGCLSGALDEIEYQQQLAVAGFTQVQVMQSIPLSGSEIEQWAQDTTASEGGCCGGDRLDALSEKIYSAQIWAVKPVVSSNLM